MAFVVLVEGSFQSVFKQFSNEALKRRAILTKSVSCLSLMNENDSKTNRENSKKERRNTKNKG